MHRRRFLASLTASAAIAGSVSFASLAQASAHAVPYSAKQLQGLLASGKTVLLDFAATWCTTCRAQERVLDSLMGGGAYNNIVLMRVDWDTYRDTQIVSDLSIPRRSTLVLLRGNKELGRVVAQTGQSAIKGLLDKAG